MPQDASNESRGRTTRSRNQKALHIRHDIPGKSPHSQGSSVDGTAASRVRKYKEAQQPVAGSRNEPANKEELTTLFRTVSSPSDFFKTEVVRGGIMATNPTSLSSRIAIVHQEKVLGYGKETTCAAETKDTNAVKTNDRSIATLIKIVKARSQPIAHAPVKCKTQTTSRTVEKLLNNTTGQRQSRSSTHSPSKSRARSKSRPRPKKNSSPSKKSRSKSRSKRNSDEIRSDAIKSSLSKSRPRRNNDESTSDAIKSPRPKRRNSNDN